VEAARPRCTDTAAAALHACGRAATTAESFLLEEVCGLPHLKTKKKVGINAVGNVGWRLSLN